MIKSRRMDWAGHVVFMGQMRNVYSIFVGNLMETEYSKHLGVNWVKTLKWIFGKYVWTVLI
jgi:hypothetical protein